MSNQDDTSTFTSMSDVPFPVSVLATSEVEKKGADWAAENIELRGYEVAWFNGQNWTQRMHYRPTDLGLGLARADAKYLNERHGGGYSVRPIISLAPPEPVKAVAE